MAKKERLVVVDGHAVIHRAYHALPPLTTSSGEIVNAVYGFSMILLNVIRDLKPDYIAVAFDLPGKTKRHEEYEAYKANRSAAPDDLVSQFNRVKEVVRCLNIPIYEHPGYEADDVIGTIVKKVPDNIESFVVTGDMDELQLVDRKTKVYTMKRGFTDTIIYDEAAVKNRYNLRPDQFVDYKALRGDPSDNIPGVAGIGEKTASDLISAHGSLDNVYKNIEALRPALAKKLREGREVAYLSQKLSQLVTDLPLTVDLEKAVVHDYDKSKVFALFQELGFKSLLPRLPGKPSQNNSQALKNSEPERHEHLKKTHYVLVNNKKGLDDLLKKLRRQKTFAFDTETDSVSEIDAVLVGLSICFKENEAYYIPVGHRAGGQLQKGLVLDSLKDILESPNIGKVGHNIKYDWVVMKKEGIDVGPIIFDTMVGAYLLNPSARSQKLDDLAFTELGISMVKIKEIIGEGKDEITFDQVAIERATIYSAEDADITWRLYRHLTGDLQKADMSDLMANIEAPLVPVLGKMELAGVKVDPEKIKRHSAAMTERIAVLEKSIKKRAGEDFNVASPLQLQKILFEKLNLDKKIADPRELKKLKAGGYSTSAQELEKLRDTSPIINEIFEYRELTKLKSTYVDTLPNLINEKTGRIHTSYNQTIAQTGRLSSSEPNLQNIPIRTDEGRKIREAFIADQGFVLLSADYSQIELRVIAHMAKDSEMIGVFMEGRDIHTETAAKVFKVAEDKVDKNMRRIAKIINFGIIYGVSPHGLKQQTGITREDAKELIDRYFAIHPKIKKYTEEMVQQAAELGYVETIFGRRRYLPEIRSSNFAVRGAAERMAINMPIQGTAADLMKLAMVDISRTIDKVSPRSRMLLQVHDELVFEVPEGEVGKVSDYVKKRMNEVVKLSVPIETKTSWGKNWQEAKQ